jgi:hypothetical protein
MAGPQVALQLRDLGIIGRRGLGDEQAGSIDGGRRRSRGGSTARADQRQRQGERHRPRERHTRLHDHASFYGRVVQADVGPGREDDRPA